MEKRRRCAFCNSAIHYGASFIGFNPKITVTIDGCRELVRKADFSTHLHSPKVFCSMDCFARFMGAELVDSLPNEPSQSEEEFYDNQFDVYTEIE